MSIVIVIILVIFLGSKKQPQRRRISVLLYDDFDSILETVLEWQY